MSLDPLLTLLILLSTLLHVAWNTTLRISGDRFLTFGLILCVVATVGIALAPFVTPPAPESWPYLAMSSVLQITGIIVLTLAYQYGALNLVYPLARGSNPLFVVLLAGFIAGEFPTTWGLVGIALVSIGIAGLAFSKGWPTGADRKPVFYALGTGLVIASYTVVDGAGIRLAKSDLGFYAWHSIVHAVPYVVGLALWRRGDFVRFIKANWKPGIGAGIAATTAYGIVLYALAHGAMAYVAALRETSVLIAAVVGTYMLKEEFGGRRIAAAGLVVAGLVTLQVLG
jgi:drug/metabolite transporter (DMT)-like permease